MQPLDRFSGHADLYAQYRIDYPTELYDFILSFTGKRQRTWDCATGNGQVASALADVFEQVEATDISATQLARAMQKPNIHYQVSPAEQTPFAEHTFDLITVAQALHWFDVGAFHQEVRRVAKPGAVIAEWGYGLVQLDQSRPGQSRPGQSRPDSTLDSILLDFYRNRIGPYWDPQRKYIDNAYATLPFPFENVQHAAFTVRRTWSLERFLNYLRTWSAVQQYIHENEEDPVNGLGEELAPGWGNAEREISFPVFLRLGLVATPTSPD